MPRSTAVERMNGIAVLVAPDDRGSQRVVALRRDRRAVCAAAPGSPIRTRACARWRPHRPAQYGLSNWWHAVSGSSSHESAARLQSSRTSSEGLPMRRADAQRFVDWSPRSVVSPATSCMYSSADHRNPCANSSACGLVQGSVRFAEDLGPAGGVRHRGEREHEIRHLGRWAAARQPVTKRLEAQAARRIEVAAAVDEPCCAGEHRGADAGRRGVGVHQRTLRRTLRLVRPPAWIRERARR